MLGTKSIVAAAVLRFASIIPMVLVNGAIGIGTGYSTRVPCYNPIDLVENMLRMIDGQSIQEMVPWYFNFEVCTHFTSFI